jgi:hypothetical protein
MRRLRCPDDDRQQGGGAPWRGLVQIAWSPVSGGCRWPASRVGRAIDDRRKTLLLIKTTVASYDAWSMDSRPHACQVPGS